MDKRRKLKKKIWEKREINVRLIKDRISRDIRICFEQEYHGDYLKSKIVSKFWNRNYIEYEKNGDKNKSLSLDEYLAKIRHYLWEIIIDLQESDAWIIQLTITINFTFS